MCSWKCWREVFSHFWQWTGCVDVKLNTLASLNGPIHVSIQLYVEMHKCIGLFQVCFSSLIATTWCILFFPHNFLIPEGFLQTERHSTFSVFFSFYFWFMSAILFNPMTPWSPSKKVLFWFILGEQAFSLNQNISHWPSDIPELEHSIPKTLR